MLHNDTFTEVRQCFKPMFIVGELLCRFEGGEGLNKCTDDSLYSADLFKKVHYNYDKNR